MPQRTSYQPTIRSAQSAVGPGPGPRAVLIGWLWEVPSVIYCVIGDNLRPYVERAFPKDDRIALGDSQWLVRSDDSTTMFVWERLVTEADAPATPSGIVLAVNGYYGYREASIWEWLAAKRRVDNGS